MSLGKLSDVYYTASQARRELGLTEDAFQGWIKAKKITKIAIPNRKQGVFDKREIDMIAASIDAAYLLAKSPLRFEKATLETQPEEFKLAVQNFGEGTQRFNDKRIELLKKNPDMAYYVYDSKFMVASIDFVPISHEAIMMFKDGERGWLLGDYVEQFATDHPLECIIIDFMTTTLAPRNRRAQYAQYLLTKLSATLVEMVDQGVEIATIHACGGTPDGRHLLEKAQFTYLGEPRPGRHIYELDIIKSESPLVQKYRDALAKRR